MVGQIDYLAQAVGIYMSARCTDRTVWISQSGRATGGGTYEIHPGRNFVASMRHCMNQIADWLVIDDVQGVVIAVLSSGTLDLLAFACVTTVP